MISKYIDSKIFFISLAIGLFFVYINQPPPTIIYVYPTPSNIDKIQYKDKVGNCFEFDTSGVRCPSEAKDVTIAPIQ